VLILLSDGGDNASEHSYADVIELAKYSGTIIYAIGIFDAQDGDQNPGVLRRLAMETGGEAFFPESSRDIVQICAKIARNIRNEYTLAYVPTSAGHPESYRVIEVKANESGLERLSVRTRTGYSVPSAATSLATR
jgi:VWFA-related protein